MSDIQQFTADLHWAAARLRTDYGESRAADLLDQWAESADIPIAKGAGTVTVTVEHVEAALRRYLAILDYDLHKNLECGEETGEDSYADEAADLYGHLISASKAGA